MTTLIPNNRAYEGNENYSSTMPVIKEKSDSNQLDEITNGHGSKKGSLSTLKKVQDIFRIATSCLSGFGGVVAIASVGIVGIGGAVTVAVLVPMIPVSAGVVCAVVAVGGGLASFFVVAAVTGLVCLPLIITQCVIQKKLDQANIQFTSFEELSKNLLNLNQYGIKKEVIETIYTSQEEYKGYKQVVLQESENYEALKAQTVSMYHDQWQAIDTKEKTDQAALKERLEKQTISFDDYQVQKINIEVDAKRKKETVNVAFFDKQQQDVQPLQNAKQRLIDFEKKVLENLESIYLKDEDIEIKTKYDLYATSQVLKGKDYMSYEKFKAEEKEKENYSFKGTGFISPFSMIMGCCSDLGNHRYENSGITGRQFLY